MSEPVDTDALRMNAVEATRRGGDWGIVGQQLDDAADEVDRLRVENEHLAGELSAVTANRDHAVYGYQRLRVVIENAPHDHGCASRTTALTVLPPRPAPCTCWKADVL